MEVSRPYFGTGASPRYHGSLDRLYAAKRKRMLEQTIFTDIFVISLFFVLVQGWKMEDIVAKIVV